MQGRHLAGTEVVGPDRKYNEECNKTFVYLVFYCIGGVSGLSEIISNPLSFSVPVRLAYEQIMSKGWQPQSHTQLVSLERARIICRDRMTRFPLSSPEPGKVLGRNSGSRIFRSHDGSGC